MGFFQVKKEHWMVRIIQVINLEHTELRYRTRKKFHCRGGSRVVQVISRNHSNFSKPTFVISQVLSCSSRNQLSFLFYCLSWSKTKKKASYFVIPSITQQPALPEWIRRVSVRTLSSFVETSEYNTKKISYCTTGQNLYAVGGQDGTEWFMNLFTNHSKPSSIGQKHAHCLAKYSNSVVIGYPGHKLPWKLLTIVYKGKHLPERPFVCPCSD